MLIGREVARVSGSELTPVTSPAEPDQQPETSTRVVPCVRPALVTHHKRSVARAARSSRVYGVHAIASGVPLNLLSKWMGHASLEVTAIHADALGAEEQRIAARMWSA